MNWQIAVFVLETRGLKAEESNSCQNMPWDNMAVVRKFNNDFVPFLFHVHTMCTIKFSVKLHLGKYFYAVLDDVRIRVYIFNRS